MNFLYRSVPLISSLCFSTSFGFAEGPFTFELKNYPVDESSCVETAQTLATKLAQETSVQIIGTRCSREIGRLGGGQHISIHYLSPEKLKDGTLAQDRSGSGYLDQKNCLADLPEQEKLFSQATQSPIFTSYCSRDGLLTIISLSKSNRNRFLFSSNLGGQYAMGNVLIGDREIMVMELTQAMTERGHLVSRVAIQSSLVDIYYYADKEDFDIQWTRGAPFHNHQECRSEFNTVDVAFSAMNAKTLWRGCFSDEDFPSPDSVSYYLVASKFGYFASHVSRYSVKWPLAFPSIQECHESRSQIERRVIQDFGKTRVYASYCSMISDRNREYEITVLAE